MENMIYLVHDAADISQWEFKVYKDPIEKDQHIEMKYFEGDVSWTNKVRGKTAVTLRDFGNGFKLKFDNGMALQLDYDQADKLMHLLNFLNEDSGINQFVSKVQKFKEVQ